MIEINLLRPQPEPLTESERILLEGMLMNAYRQGIAQGEQNMAAKVISRCQELDRRSVERRRGERRTEEGGIWEKK